MAESLNLRVEAEGIEGEAVAIVIVALYRNGGESDIEQFF